MTDARVDSDVTESGAALDRYRTALRRQRLVYGAVLGAIVVVLAIGVSVAWSRGEVANTSLHTVSRPPANLTIGQPTTSAKSVWHTDDRVAIGSPRYGGTVVVYGRHTVRGLDARTGEQTWSYTRSNRVVCAALQSAGTTVAVYRVGGNCDELTALASDTGKRRWTRTLDQDGQPINGRASYQVFPYSVVVSTSSFVYVIDPSSGINRWTYGRYGCAIGRVTLGSAGALISQTCTNPRCAGLKFCGRGPQLLLRDANAPVDDKTKNPSNFDQIKWNLIGNTDVPVSADGVVAALNTTTRALDLFKPAKGKASGSVTLSPAPAGSGPIASVSVAGPELVTVRGVAAVLSGDAGRSAWSRAVTAPLTAVPLTDSGDLTLGNARVTVPTSTGAAVLDGTSGRVVTSITLTPGPAAGSSIFPLGAGQLASGPAGTVAYR